MISDSFQANFNKSLSGKPEIIFSLLLILFSPLFIFAQNDWKPGYIIPLQGDTLYGYIDYRSPSNNAERCYFKASENASVIQYTPVQIAGYRYEGGKFYVSRQIREEHADATLFLEYLIKGRVNIYYLKTDIDRYFAEKDSLFLELKNSEQLKTDGNNTYLTSRNEYIGLLTYLMSEQNMQDEINKLTLTHNSLIQLARKYHDRVCDDQQCIIYEKKIKKTIFHFGPVYGLNYRSLHLDYYMNYYLRNKLTQYAGLEISVSNLPGIYERFSLGSEILCTEYFLLNSRKYALNIPLMVRYRFSAKKLYPTIEAGFSSYYIHNDFYNVSHFTLSGGMSLYYEYRKNCKIFMQTRFEFKPMIFRTGVGLLF